MICHIHLWSFFVFINVRSIVFPLVILLWCPSLRSDLGDFNFEKLKSLGQRFLFYCIFLFYLGFFFSRITELSGKGEGISITPHFHFHPLHRHLDISQVITAESSPLYIGSSWTQTGNLWFPRTSQGACSYGRSCSDNGNC